MAAHRIVVVRGEYWARSYLAAALVPVPDLLVLESVGLAALPELVAGAGPAARRFLLLNVRDRDGEILDEMDVLALVTLPEDGRWSVAASEDADSCRRVLAREADRAAAGGPEPALPGYFLGMDWVGLREARNAVRAINEKALFRHYGVGQPTFAEALETEFRRRFRARFALAVSSCSAALNCAVHALGLGPGDEVVLPAFSWFSCYNAIRLCGADPVFCEIDGSLNLDPADLARRITPRTRAVIVVHYQGGPTRMDEVMRIAREHRLRVIEDCAQAVGAEYHGAPVGVVGDIGVYSFQANKILCSGEGGMLVCGEQSYFERAVRYHDLGFMRRTFEQQLTDPLAAPPCPGNQYRMSELTAAVALGQLTRLDWILGRCRNSWTELRGQLNRSVPDLGFRISGCDKGDAGITLFLDCRSPARAQEVSARLASRGVKATASSGMVNLLTVDYVAAHPRTPRMAELPATASWLARMVPVPIGPRYSGRHVQVIAAAIAEAWRDSHEKS